MRHLHPLEISTGQKRRLSVATATGGVPEVMIFDEPTFGLDQKLSYELLKMFYERVEGRHCHHDHSRPRNHRKVSVKKADT